jgi:hypothetical protein
VKLTILSEKQLSMNGITFASYSMPEEAVVTASDESREGSSNISGRHVNAWTIPDLKHAWTIDPPSLSVATLGIQGSQTSYLVAQVEKIGAICLLAL